MVTKLEEYDKSIVVLLYNFVNPLEANLSVVEEVVFAVFLYATDTYIRIEIITDFLSLSL